MSFLLYADGEITPRLNRQWWSYTPSLHLSETRTNKKEEKEHNTADPKDTDPNTGHTVDRIEQVES